ncbi:mitochondrial carrier domain-containing protein [Catenaria anguillulae PL171]|uniref:Mitochondrial carrier domain-containing protein n=1 Tax=Catenaria anguillulae PL171 TaxID=765915 RepID=A0A1Y2HTS5_9FUNG|nr:mitochondrial carrier domain-containing protein [Catenaria anguillulae PL171]
MGGSNSLPPFGHALSGSAGALIALALTYPLDIIKTRMQVQSGALLKKSNRAFVEDEDLVPEYTSMWHAFQSILGNEGIEGLYAGLPAGLLGTASSNFAYFFWYQTIREYHARRATGPTSTAVELALGALAGALSQLTTIPVSVVITRQQTTPKARRMTFSETWMSIVREEGVTALWKGLKPSMVLVSNPAITFGMFERLKTLVVGKQAGRPLSSGEVFVIGAMAKTLATVVTYPYIMAKVRLQWKPPKEHAHNPELQFKSAMDVLRKVLKAEGLVGWYKGMQPQILKAVLSQALLFVLKDKIDKYTLVAFMLVRGASAGSSVVVQRNR